MKKSGKIFYGWVIAGCCLLSVCGASLLSTGMSTNLNAMRQSIGLTHTQTSMILTVRSISAFVVALFADRYYRLFGVKKGLIFALFAGILAFLLFAAAGANMTVNYIAAVVTGFCYSYGLMMPASMLIKNWFLKSRGTALSIASCGTAFVSIIFAPLVQTIVNNHGVRIAFLMQGGVLLLIIVLLIVLVAEKPEDKGLEPCGGLGWVSAAKGAKKSSETSLTKGWFIALVAATALIGLSSSPASANYTNNLVTAGLDPMDVAKCLSVYGFVLLLAKMVFGRLIDSLGTFRTTILFGSLCAFAMLLLTLVSAFPGIGMMYAAMIMIGIGAPIQTLGYPNWTAELDAKHYNRTIEKCQMGYQLGCVVGSPIPGMIADRFGDYRGAYLVFMACTVIAIAIVIGAFRSSYMSRVKSQGA